MENDGGPAFPKGFPDAGTTSKGMSLRDWFAGQALPNLIRAFEESETCGRDDICKWAYAYADAMLAEREKSDAPSP